MPETTPATDATRKRSRPSSDSDTEEQQASKRANISGNNDVKKSKSQESTPPPGDADVPMVPSTSAEGDAKGTENRTADATASASNERESKESATAASAAGIPATPAPSTAVSQIHMRCLIVTQDASIIIGKGGSNVTEIREKSGAKVMVSESIPGNPERILNVSGALDAVSKAFGLIVRRINDEPFDVPSVPGSRAVTIKFIIPNSRMGSVIGKQGSKIKEIQEASGARLNASEGMLPGSTERVLSVTGVADAIHIATYYVGNILIQLQDSMPASGSYRQSRSSRHYDAGSSYQPHSQVQPYPYAAAPPQPGMPTQTQQIYIPNDLVGCIIGKGGAKINEIRQMSASQIKIMEPGAVGTGGTVGGENDRLVVITGQPANIQVAVGMLYHRLEQEKQKQMMGSGGSGAAGGSGGGMRLM